MKEHLYRVSNTGSPTPRYVIAPNKARAVAHVAADTLSAARVDGIQGAEAVAAGATIERAGEAPAAVAGRVLEFQPAAAAEAA